MKKKFIYISMAAFLAITTFCACSNDVEDSMPVPAKEEEAVINDNPYAVTIDEAEKILEQILANENEQVTKGGGVAHQRRIKSRYSIGGNSTVTRSANGEDVATEEPVLHIFNFENNEGFAVMGGDKRGAPMLALTESGEFIPGATIENPGMSMSLTRAEAINRQMIIEAGSDTAYVINGQYMIIVVTDSVTFNKHGQCPVNWGQWHPYNQFCPPYYFGNNNYPTGCVTTAVAQLMSIHKYPASYGNCVFDWDAMIADSTHIGIGFLMQLLANSDNLDIDYDYNGSSGSIADAPIALHNFGYAHPGVYDDYNISTIMSNLTIGLPVLIRGEGAFYTTYLDPNTPQNINSGGHAWLGDGCAIIQRTMLIYNFATGQYIAQGPIVSQYVHCNFGWSGKGNGLFLSGHYNTNDSNYRPDDPNPFTGGFARDFNLNTDMAMVTGISK